MGLVDYISRQLNQIDKQVPAYDEEFVVAKLKVICASVISLKLKSNEPAPHLHCLIQAHDPAPQVTPKIDSTSRQII